MIYEQYAFNKNTVFDCYVRFRRKGIYHTLLYYQNELRKLPDVKIFMHIKPGYQNLVNFLKSIEENCEDNKHLEKKVTGKGPVDNGEYLGTFVDYFMCDDYYAKKFNELIAETAFGFVPIIDFRKTYNY